MNIKLANGVPCLIVVTKLGVMKKDTLCQIYVPKLRSPASPSPGIMNLKNDQQLRNLPKKRKA